MEAGTALNPSFLCIFCDAQWPIIITIGPAYIMLLQGTEDIATMRPASHPQTLFFIYANSDLDVIRGLYIWVDVEIVLRCGLGKYYVLGK